MEGQNRRVDYRLEDLGAYQFERMCQALLLRVLGPGVQVFGSGPDGGRDATFTGPSTLDGRSWSGYHVFQVKFCEQPGAAEDNRKWLARQVRMELDHWTSPHSRRKGLKPEYIVFLTNVGLSGTVGGGLDQTADLIRSAAKDGRWPLSDCAVLDRSTVCRLLDGYADVRQAFNGLITPGDVLALSNLKQMTGLGTRADEMRPLLEEHTRSELLTRGSVNFGEAGQVANEKLDLAQVAVDLPARIVATEDPDASTVMALDHILKHGDRVLRPSVRSASGAPHFLLIGGPGQGKTTMGRLLTQIYRACMLDPSDTLSVPVRAVATGTLDRIAALGVHRPSARRWAVRVDLAEYGDEVSGGADMPLLRWIANKIAEQSTDSFTARDMRAWLSAWPWLLVLDGFDEVAAVEARERVAAAVTSLLETAHTEDADLLVVATTRPQGYADEFPASFAKLELVDLNAEQAVTFATQLTEMRLGHDPDKGAIVERIAAASKDPLTRRLMRTPLQVMIMSLLLERRSRPPQDRYGLFAAYYDTVYDREVQKKNHLARLLDDYRADVDAIHQNVGFALQARSEGLGDSEAVLSSEELEGLIRQRLGSQGNEGRQLETLTKALLQAATDRLVLLVVKGRAGVGFELRSLQEFLAAQALVAGPEGGVVERLRVTALSAHWHNVWLLAAGSLFKTKPHLFDRLLHMLREVDAEDPLFGLVAAGPRLAVDLLDDDLATKAPKYRKMLVNHALEMLNGVPLGASRLGEVLAVVGNDDAVRKSVITALERSWAGAPDAHQCAASVLDFLADEELVGPLSLRARQIRGGAKRRSVQPPGTGAIASGKSVTLADALPRYARLWPREQPQGEFFSELKRARTTTGPDGEFILPGGLTPGPGATAVVKDRDALETVILAAMDIPASNWSGTTAIASLLWRARERLPVVPELSTKMPEQLIPLRAD